jgi:formylmethanofuran dehydrogenase subunit A
MTRAGPAKLLGLKDRGQLGVGAAADIAVYREDADRERMFTTPEYVFKDGTLVSRAGRVLELPTGGTHFVQPDYDRSIETVLKKRMATHGSMTFENSVIGHDELCACCNGGRLLPVECFENAST